MPLCRYTRHDITWSRPGTPWDPLGPLGTPWDPLGPLWGPPLGGSWDPWDPCDPCDPCGPPGNAPGPERPL
eukprot:6820376-Prymnesium_polylepis.1